MFQSQKSSTWNELIEYEDKYEIKPSNLFLLEIYY